jgi:hypothetical protein
MKVFVPLLLLAAFLAGCAEIPDGYGEHRCGPAHGQRLLCRRV